MLTETEASDAIADLAEELGAPCWHDLCEKDDRTSPEDYPDHALITRDELVEYIKVSLDMAQDPKALPRAMWRDMESAPKDGTRILIWFVHANAAFSKDPVGEGWAAAHEAHWLDHNKGGWTWHGLCGVATKWQPLPAAPNT